MPEKPDRGIESGPNVVGRLLCWIGMHRWAQTYAGYGGAGERVWHAECRRCGFRSVLLCLR